MNRICTKHWRWIIFIALVAVSSSFETQTTYAQVKWDGKATIVGYKGKCMDIPNQQAKVGKNLHMWDCHGQASQQWSISNDGQIRSLGMCLDIEGKKKNGAPAQIANCEDMQDQYWKLTSSGQIRSGDGWCLDVRGPSSANGTALQIWHCSTPQSKNQTWKASVIAGPPVQPESQYICPIPRGTDGFSYSNDYGYMRTLEQIKRGLSPTHDGIDIFSPKTTPIYAIEDGEASSQKKSSSDKIVRLYGASGAYYFYGHLHSFGSKLKVAKNGESARVKVKKGDIIGTVGNTGNARGTSPHIHFEVRLNGRSGARVDPYPLVRGWCGDTKQVSSSEPAPAPVPASVQTGICKTRPYLTHGAGFASRRKAHQRDDARALQRLMNEKRTSLNAPGFQSPLTEDGYLGDDSTKALKAIQQFGLNKYGKINGTPVLVDGEAGPQTYKILCE